MKNIIIRVDANNKIATGHISRVLSIARALVSLGLHNIISQNNIYFIVSDEKGKEILERSLGNDEIYPIITEFSDCFDLDSSIDKLSKELDELEADFLFLDSYYIKNGYFKRLKAALPEKLKSMKIAYFDDLLAFGSYEGLDLIINYDSENIPKQYAGIPNILAGPQYTPLRSQFENVDYEIRNEVKKIFISAGGTDPQNMCVDTIITLSEISSKLSFVVLTSELNEHLKELRALRDYYDLQVCTNVSDVASLMAECDLAVSAGGTTLCELCAVGIPSISFLIADNQYTEVISFKEKGLIPYAGSVIENKNKVLTNIKTLSKNIINMYQNERMNLSANMRLFIDGCGSKKIAEAIIALLPQ